MIRRTLTQPKSFVMLLLALMPPGFLLLMIETNKFNHAIFDNQIRSLPIALAVAADGLDWRLIFQAYDGQLSVMHNLVNIIMTATTRWNLNIEVHSAYILAWGVWIGCVVLLAHLNPKRLPIGAVILSALIFSLHQNANWFVSYVSSWQWTFFFLIWGFCALLLLRERPWGGLFLAAALSLLATFSFGNGVVSWVGLGLALILLGYRKPSYWLVWGALTVAAVLLYITVAGIGVGAGEGAGRADVSLSLEALPTVFFFAVNLFANPFVIGQPTLALVVTLMALIWVTVNLGVMTFRQQNVDGLAVWGGLTLYGVIVIGLVAVARYADYPDRELAAFYAWYRTATTPFWMGTAMVVWFVTGRLLDTPTRTRFDTALLYVNISLGMVATFLFGYSSMVNEAHPLGDNGFRFREEWGMYEDCYVRYLFTQNWWTEPDDRCGGAIDNAMMSFDKSLLGSEHSNLLAQYRLNLYADVPLQSIVASRLAGDSVVVLDEPRPWAQFHMRTFLLDGVAPNTVHHVISSESVALNNPLDLRETFTHLYQTAEGPVDEALMEAVMQENPQIVYVLRQSDQEAALSTFRASLEEAGYAAVSSETDVYPVQFNVVRYERSAASLAEPFIFNERVSLTGWALLPSEACDRATLQTWWTAGERLPDAPYSLYVEVDGGVVSESGLGYVPTHVWEQGKTYLDEREVVVPCEGTPEIRVGVYDPATGAARFTLPDGNNLAALAR
jgi:hypothetical protein